MIRKKSGYIQQPPKIKFLGINLTKKLKELYNKNYKTLMKEIEDTRKQKDPPIIMD
jgi:hypothetical protein